MLSASGPVQQSKGKSWVARHARSRRSRARLATYDLPLHSCAGPLALSIPLAGEDKTGHKGAEEKRLSVPKHACPQTSNANPAPAAATLISHKGEGYGRGCQGKAKAKATAGQGGGKGNGKG